MECKNRLGGETSPYLSQHKNQPVDWFPWCDEAFEKARIENKPIFLSIGYSACHWCHVMAMECFTDGTIARQMNEQFINIKVDREERPDVDTVYMKALISQTGQGGWPLSLFLTPMREFYFGGTYFPPQPRFNQPGFPQILDQAQTLFRDQKAQLQTRIQTVMKKMDTGSRFEGSSGGFNARWMETAGQILFERFDETFGGFGTGMKFPEPMLYALLLRHWRRFESQSSMEMLDKSLTRMAQGGIYDQLGGGFHRYSTDRAWRVPHFEKMLCDNALLAKLYLETFQATKQEMYEDVPREIFGYVLREMTSPQGYFYSSQDADSEEREGTYYVWELREVLNLLGPKHAKIFARVFGLSSGGNFEGNKNVLHLRDSLEKVSEEEDVPIFEVDHIVKSGKRILLETRGKRHRPGRDEKMITSWNAMMITALATGASVLDDASYLTAAAGCADFIWSAARNGKGLLRVFKDGQSKIPGFLEDYVYFLESQLTLYEASFDLKWVQRALTLADEMIERFWDPTLGGFFIYGKHHEKLIHQPKNPQDEAQPSGNAIAALSLIQLGRLTGEKKYTEKGEEVLQVFQSILERQPASVTGLLTALDVYLDPPTEIVLTGSMEDPVFKKMLRVVHKDFRPNKILVYAKDETSRQLFPLAEGKTVTVDQSTAYLCQKGTCHAPVKSGEALENQLERPPLIKVNIFDEEKSKQELESRQNEDFLNAMSQIFKHSGFGKI